MTDLTTYEAIRERLVGLTGPDRETDFAIVRALAPGAIIGTYIEGDDGDVVFHARELGIPDKSPCPALTGSCDAILALIERDLPAWCYFADNGWQAFGRTADPLALLPKHFCLAYIEAKIQIAKAGGQNG